MEQIGKRLSFIQKSGYALGIHGIMYFWYATNLYLFYYYTDVVGLSPAQTGMIFLISLIWDGVTDPIMGWITDRLVARGYRYRTLFLIGAFPFCLSFVALFSVPAAVDAFIYCLIANLVFRVFFTMTYVPYTSMLTRITPSSKERASIGGFKSIFIGFSKLPVSYLVLTMVAVLGVGSEALGFSRTMTIIAIMAGLAFLGCYFLSPKENTESGETRLPSFSFGEITSYFRANSQFWIILLALFWGSGSFGILMQSIIYYYKYNLDASGSAKLAFTAIALGGIFVVPMWMFVVRNTSARITWFAGCAVATVSLAAFYFLSPGVWPAAILVGCAASGIYGFIMVYLPMTADSVDYGEWKSGHRVEAFTFGFMSLGNKLSIGFAGWLLGVMQTYVGFKPNLEQSDATLQGLKGIISIAPAIGLTLSGLCILWYRIDAKFHNQIVSGKAV